MPARDGGGPEKRIARPQGSLTDPRLNTTTTPRCSPLPFETPQGGMRTLGTAIVAVAALALAAVATLSAREETRIVMEAKPSQELALVRGEQQTTQLKAVWKPLRNQDPGFYPDRVWLYAGRETYLWGRGKEIGDLKNILRKGHYETTVMTFNSLKIAPLRAVAWDESTHVMIFPPFAEYPDLHDIAKKDLKNYVSTGNNIVFLGGFASIGLMNEIFGFALKAETYQSGPFYQNERYARGTVFEYLPSRLGEDGLIYGCKLQSLPPGGKSFYDSLGDSVAWSVRYDFGMITYVANNYMSVRPLPPARLALPPPPPLRVQCPPARSRGKRERWCLLAVLRRRSPNFCAGVTDIVTPFLRSFDSHPAPCARQAFHMGDWHKLLQAAVSI